MMQEVSLTGATLLDGSQSSSHNHHHSHSHSHQQDPLAQQQQQQHQDAWLHPNIEMTAKVVSPNSKNACNHNHNNSATACHHNKTLIQSPQLSLTIPVAQLVQQEPTEIIKALWQITRMGSFTLFRDIIQQWKQQQHVADKETSLTSIQTIRDPAGHSLLHWATKRPDHDWRFAAYLVNDCQVPVTTQSHDATAMTALHWAATLPSRQALPLIRILLAPVAATSSEQLSVALELGDSTGCTPLLIAAQHGQVETVAYLVQRGAAISAVDHNRDSAVHWAAYKGSLEVLGLLQYYAPQTAVQWTAPDVYGQMPLHLAALRGHVTACRYILQQLQSSRRDLQTILYHQDKNRRTPLALAQHKQKPTVASTLQQAMEGLRTNKSKQMAAQTWKRRIQTAARNLVSAHEWKVWLGLPEVDDVDESPKFPYYYVVFHIGANLLYLLTVLWPIFNVGAGLLWDQTAWLGIMLVLWGLTVWSLRMTSNTNPGRLDAHHPHIQHWRRMYETTLSSLADDDDDDDDDKKTTTTTPQRPQLCHTCHIARPRRSKHDRFTGGCIEQFDHHCPFVSATVGLYNYRWFLLFLSCMTLYFLCLAVHLVRYAVRTTTTTTTTTPWGTLMVGVVLCAHVLFPAGMLVYHGQLVLANLTTNEHVNRHKYEYLWKKKRTNNSQQEQPPPAAGGVYANRYDRGPWRNLQSRLFPSAASYQLDDDDDDPQQQAHLLDHVV